MKCWKCFSSYRVENFQSCWAEHERAGGWPKIPGARGPCQCLPMCLGDRKAHHWLMYSTHSCRTLSFYLIRVLHPKKAFQWHSCNSASISSIRLFGKSNILICPIIELRIDPESFTSPHLFNCKSSLHFQNCLFRYFPFPAQVLLSKALHTGEQIQAENSYSEPKPDFP